MCRGQKSASASDWAFLVARIRERDPAAEEDLVNFFLPRIYTMLVTRTRDREAARDLTQDVLLSVLGALRNGQLRRPESLESFIYGTARNQLSSFARGTWKRNNPVPVSADGPFDPASQLAIADRSAQFVEALKQLSTVDRQILLLSLVDGKKPREIASLLGYSPEALRKRKSRAVRRIIALVRDSSRQ
jgi:RNA polymerase sigma factor (sigma-70 family)